jgi:hypothetical protein
MAVKAGADGGRQVNEFEVVRLIERSVEEVFAVLPDGSKTPLWEPGLLEVRRTNEGPLGVRTFLGRRYESRAASTGFAENKQFATATTGAPFYLEVDQMVESAGAGAKLMLHCRGDSSGFFKLAEPLVVRLTKRQVQTAVGNLKARREQNALTVSADLRLGHAHRLDSAVTSHLWPGVSARSGRPPGQSGRIPA